MPYSAPPPVPPPQQQYPNMYPAIQNGQSSPDAPHPCAPPPFSQGTPIHKADTSHTQVYTSFFTNLVGGPFSGKFKSPRADLYSRTSSSSTPSRGFSGTQSLEKIREGLVRDGRLFEDPEFPADDQSLFPSGRSVKKLVWRRPFVCYSLSCLLLLLLSLSLFSISYSFPISLALQSPSFECCFPLRFFSLAQASCTRNLVCLTNLLFSSDY